MAGDIPFDKKLDLKPDVVDEVAPGIRRVLTNNPGPFTFTGTLSYIVGRGKVAIIDPGPNDAAHIGALLDAVRGETVTHIFVTHTHRDHSPAVPAIRIGVAPSEFAAIEVLMPEQPYETSSWTRQLSRQVPPRPPYASGISMFIRPVSQAFFRSSRGNSPVSSKWAAFGMISLRVKSRAVCASAFCSSVRLKSMAAGL